MRNQNHTKKVSKTYVWNKTIEKLEGILCLLGHKIINSHDAVALGGVDPLPQSIFHVALIIFRVAALLHGG